MHLLPLSETASSHLTKSVVRYQMQHTDQSLYRSLHEQTQQLLYELPSFLHLIDEEDCCEFLFFCYAAIPYYLNTYREGRLSYIGYLSQVVRKRSRYFLAQQQLKRKKELLVAESDYHFQQDDNLPEATAESAAYCGFSAIPQQDIQALPSLFAHLMHRTTSLPPQEDEKLGQLQQALGQPVNRRRFLIMLTLSPQLASQHLLEDLASLLGVEAFLLCQYLNTANSVLAQKQACKEEFETTSHRHFRRLLEIEAELLREDDATKRQRLEELCVWTKHVYTAKIKQIRRMEQKMSHSELGNLLGIPKGTIDSSVHYMKRLLSRYMDEQGDNEYL